MKAKIKETGIIYNFHQFGDDVELWKCDETKMVYHKSALIFSEDTIDWEQRRYEIAKDVMIRWIDRPADKRAAQIAVRQADRLIDELKKCNQK